MMDVTGADGARFSALRLDPAQAPKGAVVVLSDRAGIAPESETLANALAAKGYVAIALCLAEADCADQDRALAAVRATADAARSAGKVALVGYRRGADLAYAAANAVAGLACVVAYDGRSLVGLHREKRKVPTLLHFAERDPAIPPEAVAQFRAHRPDVSAFTYPGAAQSLAPAEPDGAANKALERTLFWIAQYVEGQPPILMKNAGAYAQAKAEKKKKKTDDALGPPLD
jgi:carboxymethylenebutenolidase